MQEYPAIINGNEKDVLRRIVELRHDDVSDFTNLPQVFMSGRKAGKVPTGSADVAVTDRLGDFNYDTSYLYLAVNNAGSLVWRRVAISSW
jgi:hypothetical protein